MANRVRIHTTISENEKSSAFDGLRKILLARIAERGRGALSRMAREIGVDRSQLKRHLEKGQRFNEDQLLKLSNIEKIPIHFGYGEPPPIVTEQLPDLGPKRQARADFRLIPVVSHRALTANPVFPLSETVTDWAYMHRRSFHALNISKMAATFVAVKSDRPLIRKDVLVCISTDTHPEIGKIPPGSVWAAAKGERVVIGHIEDRRGSYALRRDIPPPSEWELLDSLDEVVGRVCWIWHSLI